MDLSMGVLCGWRRPTMEILYPRCAGLDVHKESVAVCADAGTSGGAGQADPAVRHHHILESACPLILVNARHVKQVPGRKTDKADCAWIASLLRHGLLEASFVPEPEVRELRDLCRMRTTLVRECVQVGNRLRKVLEDANIKLDSVASDALGVSGREMILALADGRDDPAELAELARGRLRAKLPELEKALEGQVTAHH